MAGQGRAFLIVMDSVGAGGAPDAGDFGDAGACTLGHRRCADHPVRRCIDGYPDTIVQAFNFPCVEQCVD